MSEHNCTIRDGLEKRIKGNQDKAKKPKIVLISGGAMDSISYISLSPPHLFLVFIFSLFIGNFHNKC